MTTIKKIKVKNLNIVNVPFDFWI